MASLIPNTLEWEEMRKDKIGASDAPIIMGASPYATPFQLWQKKLGLAPETVQTPAMMRGHQLEPRARAEVERLTGLLLTPTVKFHSDLPWMMATLDGIDVDEKVCVEIKCPGAEDHAKALSGMIPEKYIPQVQHQLEVCQIEKGYYFSYDGKEGVLLEFFRDDKYIQKLVSVEKEFYTCMQEMSPPDLTDRDCQLIESPEWAEAASCWRYVNESLKKLELEEKHWRQKLILMSRNKSSMGSGVRVSTFPRKGKVEYERIPELQGVDLEQYRKKPTECWKITAAK